MGQEQERRYGMLKEFCKLTPFSQLSEMPSPGWKNRKKWEGKRSK